MIPTWLHVLSILMLLLGLACAIWIARDEFRYPQPMWIMNAVWPITALFGTVFVLWFYLAYGRAKTHDTAMADMGEGTMHSHHAGTPFPIMVVKGALHCGSGCTLGDIIAEGLAFSVPVVAVWFGWQHLFAEKIFAVWILDFILAFGFGVLFQYFTIKPMRNLSVGEGIREAIKADALSLAAWQVGMYGVMAVGQFLVFQPLYGSMLEASDPAFWFLMQIAMLAGLATSYPVNWWLIRSGIKEPM
ncbi:hypothetical protein HDIA_1602 [Hartmannibacter diazotrophicus]|uniref:DUF4396 domain-containing protein n=1 Tax=Hartmannibacter diazotrophicus TaxID=1482074 RepID=A0A2C9D4J6_9HYPH|nr:DUF4396 domain-containing protein [Hartmannibacter diazotrophicus]SON55143.1 hypothetical protein HDIA_1602 [Hartmannibacter diazotrophicus]